jgi:hypothetical protein
MQPRALGAAGEAPRLMRYTLNGKPTVNLTFMRAIGSVGVVFFAAMILLSIIARDLPIATRLAGLIFFPLFLMTVVNFVQIRQIVTHDDHQPK